MSKPVLIINLTKLPWVLESSETWHEYIKLLTMNLTKLPWVLESSQTWHEYIKHYFETKLAILRLLYDFSRIFQQDVLTGRTDESQVPSDEGLVLLSKKSAICDKLVNASNLKLLHGLSLKPAKIVSVLLPGLDCIFHTSPIVAYGRWNARGFVN